MMTEVPDHRHCSTTAGVVCAAGAGGSGSGGAAAAAPRCRNHPQCRRFFLLLLVLLVPPDSRRNHPAAVVVESYCPTITASHHRQLRQQQQRQHQSPPPQQLLAPVNRRTTAAARRRTASAYATALHAAAGSGKSGDGGGGSGGSASAGVKKKKKKKTTTRQEAKESQDGKRTKRQRKTQAADDDDDDDDVSSSSSSRKDGVRSRVKRTARTRTARTASSKKKSRKMGEAASGGVGGVGGATSKATDRMHSVDDVDVGKSMRPLSSRSLSDRSMLDHDLLSKSQDIEFGYAIKRCHDLLQSVDALSEEKELQRQLQQQQEEEEERRLRRANDDDDDSDEEDDDKYDDSSYRNMLLSDPYYNMFHAEETRIDAKDDDDDDDLPDGMMLISEYGMNVLERQERNSFVPSVWKETYVEEDDAFVPTFPAAAATSTPLNRVGKHKNKSKRSNKNNSSIINGGSVNKFEHLTDADYDRLGLPGGRAELCSILVQGATARDTLIRSNVRLVVSVAKRWAKHTAGSASGMTDTSTLAAAYAASWDRPSLDEAIQEGIVGLCVAADRYDPVRGLRFSTYATHWVTSHVRRCYQRATTGCVRVPDSVLDAKRRYQKLVREHYERQKSAYYDSSQLPALEDLAAEMRISAKRLKFVLAASRPPVSTDAPAYPAASGGGGGAAGGGTFGSSGAGTDAAAAAGETISLGECLVDPEPRPDELVERSFLRMALEGAMADHLAPHERDVIRLRLGLDDGVRRTAVQVAETLSGLLTVAEVRRTEQRALKKLRSDDAMARYQLWAFCDDHEACTDAAASAASAAASASYMTITTTTTTTR